jgi:hypothetical protein
MGGIRAAAKPRLKLLLGTAPSSVEINRTADYTTAGDGLPAASPEVV